MQERKQALRRWARARRGRVPSHLRLAASRVAALHLGRWVVGQRLRHIALYSAAFGEIGLDAVAQQLWRLDACPYLPRIEPGRGLLAFAPWSPGRRLRRGGAGVWQPVGRAAPLGRLDAVVLPGLAFDAFGRRLGSGGGYYDRTLAGRRGPRLIAAAFAWQVREGALPESAWDVRVERIFTDRGVVLCRAQPSDLRWAHAPA